MNSGKIIELLILFNPILCSELIKSLVAQTSHRVSKMESSKYGTENTRAAEFMKRFAGIQFTRARQTRTRRAASFQFQHNLKAKGDRWRSFKYYEDNEIMFIK